MSKDNSFSKVQKRYNSVDTDALVGRRKASLSEKDKISKYYKWDLNKLHSGSEFIIQGFLTSMTFLGYFMIFGAVLYAIQNFNLLFENTGMYVSMTLLYLVIGLMFSVFRFVNKDMREYRKSEKQLKTGNYELIDCIVEDTWLISSPDLVTPGASNLSYVSLVRTSENQLYELESSRTNQKCIDAGYHPSGLLIITENNICYLLSDAEIDYYNQHHKK
jgi:hypothetical protein